MGTFPSAAGGGRSEEKGVAVTWRLASFQQKRRQRLSHNRKRSGQLQRKLNKYRDVAQLVARLVWDQDVAGSNPVIPTKKANGACSIRFFVGMIGREATMKFSVL